MVSRLLRKYIITASAISAVYTATTLYDISKTIDDLEDKRPQVRNQIYDNTMSKFYNFRNNLGIIGVSSLALLAISTRSKPKPSKLESCN